MASKTSSLLDYNGRVLADCFTRSFVVQAIVAVLVLAYSLYRYLTYSFDYWRQKDVPFAEPQVLFGSFKDMLTFKAHTGQAFQRIYDQFKSHKFVGAFAGNEPVLIIRDLELVKFVLTKGFANFTDRGHAPKRDHDYLQNHLFNMDGEEWRDMRRKLTPTFTSGKMKAMFKMMEKCGRQLEGEAERLVQEGSPVHCKDLISRFTSDIIASCAYGLEVDSIRDRDNEFYHMTQKMFVSSKLRVWKRAFLNLFPRLFNMLHMTMTNIEIQRYLPELVKSTISFREANNMYRGDFLDLLLRIRHNKSLEDNNTKSLTEQIEQEKKDSEYGLSLKEICSQTFVFFGAGFETAASTLTFCLYELSKRPDIQQRLRSEVVEVLETTGGEITYDAVRQMEFMEHVLNETLRLYASLPVLTRRCVHPTRLPGTDLVVQPGIRVMVPVFAIHHDPHYYPQPDTFDPDRFDSFRTDRHPYSHLPFGEGPRMCIGMRFGKMQVKVGLAALLPKFQFTLDPGTPDLLPISPSATLTTTTSPIVLHISRCVKE